jgi:hypothetical protein
MRKAMFACLRTAGLVLLKGMVTMATATLAQVRRLAAWVTEHVRLCRYQWTAARARQRLGHELCAGQCGDEDLRRQIHVLNATMDATPRWFRRWLLRRRRVVLLGQLADSALQLAEPPPGVRDAYLACRRDLNVVSECRQRVAAAWAGLWPGDQGALAAVTGAEAGAAGSGGVWKLALRGSVGLVLLTLLGWVLVAALHRPTANNETGKGPSARGDRERAASSGVAVHAQEISRTVDPLRESRERPRLVVQLGHAGFVSSVAFAPDGKQVLTGGG